VGLSFSGENSLADVIMEKMKVTELKEELRTNESLLFKEGVNCKNKEKLRHISIKKEEQL
jgi:hypothetical protein